MPIFGIPQQFVSKLFFYKSQFFRLEGNVIHVNCCKVVCSEVSVLQDQFKTKMPFEHYDLFD